MLRFSHAAAFDQDESRKQQTLLTLYHSQLQKFHELHSLSLYKQSLAQKACSYQLAYTRAAEKKMQKLGRDEDVRE
jgi:hypothetical protein